RTDEPENPESKAFPRDFQSVGCITCTHDCHGDYVNFRTTEGKIAMTKRIAVGGFLHETNTFAPTKAALANFERGGGSGPMARGEEIFARSGKSNQGIMGAIDYARAQDWDIVPTIWCAASPSAHTTQEAFETVSGEMIERIASALPLDGIYLDLHGA